MISITLNSVNINTGDTTIRSIQHDQMAPVDINTLDIVREDGTKIISTNLKPKEIKIEGVIKGTTISDFETNLDTFKKNINVVSKDLDIEYAGGTRRYSVTLANFSIMRDYYNVTHVKYTATFLVASGVGENTAVSETLSVQALTETTSSWYKTFDGSGEPKPTITYIIDTAGNLGSIRFTNNDTGTQIEVGTAWANSDQLEINTEDRTVLKNGSDVDFEGVFPRFQTGENSITSVFEAASQIDTSQEEYNQTTYVLRDSSSEKKAQSFKVNNTITFSKVAIYIGRYGDQTNLTLRIETNSGSDPSGTLVNANATKTLDGSSFSTNLGWVNFEFPAAISLTSGTQYWIVLTSTDAAPDKYTNIGVNSSNPYSNGNESNYYSSSWHPLSSRDIMFRVYKALTPTWSIDKKITYTKRYL